MKTLSTFLKPAFITTSLTTLALVSGLAMAESGAVDHSGQASKHSLLAGAHGAVSTVQVASAVAAAPILVAGTTSVMVGSVAVVLGDAVASSAANASTLSSAQNRLEISDVVITADPAPNKVLPINATEKTQTETTITTTIQSKTKTEKLEQ